jgi:hypothetical protein
MHVRNSNTSQAPHHMNGVGSSYFLDLAYSAEDCLRHIIFHADKPYAGR